MAVNRALSTACAVAIAVVLVADVAAATVVRNRTRIHTPGSLRKTLPELKRFVERTRRLSFTRGVDILLLDQKDFDTAVGRLGPDAADPARRYLESRFLVGFLKAMGLVAADFELSTLDTAGSSSLLGLYELDDKRILLRKELPGPLLRRVLVHELTHALDDQHFPIGDMQVDLRTEDVRTLQALIEGDAARVDMLYLDGLPAADRAVADPPAEGLATVPPTANPFLALLAFPYVAGPQFVQALVKRSGEAAVDAAFAARPTTSEEVLHPDRFLDRAPAVPVLQPSADGPLLGVGVLGELGLRLVLGETVSPGAALQAADGWGGDHYVAWSNNERTCVRVNLAMDSARDTGEVRDALRQWAAKHPGADLRITGDLTTVTRCA